MNFKINFKIITTQPNIYDSFLKTGLIARGQKKIIEIKLYNLHDFALDKHKSIDDIPYGGGAGMVIRADIADRAISALKCKNQKSKCKIILLTPQGKRFDQKKARELAKNDELILFSGRFEGYDERIRDLVDEEISIGDYVLTSGDLPAMVLMDAISRQIPGFIEKSESIKEESFTENLLEYPQYTRPEIFKSQKVPEILLSGDHQKIKDWRAKQAQKRTKKRRPEFMNDI